MSATPFTPESRSLSTQEDESKDSSAAMESAQRARVNESGVVISQTTRTVRGLPSAPDIVREVLSLWAESGSGRIALQRPVAGRVAPTIMSLADWRLLLSEATPAIELCGPIEEAPGYRVTTPGDIPDCLERLHSQVGGEYAWYEDGCFLEIQGVPLAGVREGVFVVGVDRRDQDMSVMAEPDKAARQLTARVRAERLRQQLQGRGGRIDLRTYARARQERAAFLACHHEFSPLEVHGSGGVGARAYAEAGATVLGFADVVDPYLVFELASVALTRGARPYVRRSWNARVHESLARAGRCLDVLVWED